MAPTRYETVLAALDAGVVIHAPDTAILEANDRARQLLGLTDLHGRLATDPAWVFLEEDMSPMPVERFPVMQVISTGVPVRGLLMILQAPDGRQRICDVSAMPLFDDTGALAEVVVTFIDVTVRESQRRDTDHLNGQLARMAITDDLTGLANRRGIVDIAEKAAASAERHGQDLSFLMLDLDRFKQVNDQHGHAAGDALLLDIAMSISHALRREDSVGRFGGEEFLAVLPASDLEAAQCVAERVRSAVESGGSSSDVTASIGVAVRRPGESADHMIARADAAMYRAKNGGRNLVRI